MPAPYSLPSGTAWPGPLWVVVLAGGRGTRMKSPLAKVLHPLAGLPIGAHVKKLAESLSPRGVLAVVPPVVGDDVDRLTELFRPHHSVLQAKAQGTGHAALLAAAALTKELTAEEEGQTTVLFLCADSPLFTRTTMLHLLARLEHNDAALLAFSSPHDYAYGRLRLVEERVVGVVESKDASEADKVIDIFNAGVMAVRWRMGQKNLHDYLSSITADNNAGEYYLTDLVRLIDKGGGHVGYELAPEEECLGVNSQADLAQAEKIFQDRVRSHMLASGVRMPDPSSVFFSHDTRVEPGVVIEPFVTIHPRVTIARGATIRSFSYLEGAVIGADAVVGPYARLRAGAVLGQGAHIGNFVEVKNTHLGSGSKANHLTYLGDSDIGEGVNIGAGTITCNYDGQKKSKTTIGRGAFIGSNTALVAPVNIGAGAVIGAGSTIVKDVAKDALAIARGQQVEVPGYRPKKWKNRR